MSELDETTQQRDRAEAECDVLDYEIERLREEVEKLTRERDEAWRKREQAERDAAECAEQTMRADRLQGALDDVRKQLDETLAKADADIRAAAGECRVALPEPGSDVAKVLCVNRLLKWLLKSERDEARAMLTADLPGLIAKFSEASSCADDLRAMGWSVAVHNDYRQDGKPRTFWLLTHPSGQWLKGEGETDREALDEIRSSVVPHEHEK